MCPLCRKRCRVWVIKEMSHEQLCEKVAELRDINNKWAHSYAMLRSENKELQREVKRLLKTCLCQIQGGQQ